jgi:MFS transporter, DHA2 family, multidrug resistance protein
MNSTSTRAYEIGVKTWVGFSAMCLGMFMAVLDIQVVVTSLPSIQAALRIEPTQTSWVQTAYLNAEVIAIPLTGFLTRVLSMRGLFVVAIILFTAASISCAMSAGFASLVVSRVVQGFAGGVLIPLVFSAVFLLFPFRSQGLATTVAGVLAVLAPTCGPLAGGWVTQTLSWHWLFLINVVPGVVSALSAWLFLPRDKPDFAHVLGLDYLSLTLMAISLTSLEIALKEGPRRGWTAILPLALLAVSILCATIFGRRVRESPAPIVDLGALRDRNFAVGCLLSFIFGMGLYGAVYLMPVFLAFVRGHGSLTIGWIMLVTGIAQLVTAPIAVEVERRMDSRLLSLLGFAFFAIGLGVSALSTRLTDGEQMFWPQVIRGCAIMFCLLPPTRIALGHLAPGNVTNASGLFNLMRNLGGAIGIALIDTFIYGNGPVIADQLKVNIIGGDIDAASAIGATEELLMQALTDERAQAAVRALIERQSIVETTNDGWMMLAIITAAAIFVVPFAKAHPKRFGLAVMH